MTRTPTATPTVTPTGRGPEILFMGIITNADGCVFCCDVECQGEPTPIPSFDNEGRRIFEVRNGSQFIIVIEAAEGESGVDVGEQLTPLPPTNRPDLQVQANRNLGNGSLAVCDIAPPPIGGGIPAIAPPRFDPGNQMITDALNDFACRFEARARTEPCTILDARRVPGVIVPGTDVQFCDQVAQIEEFGIGDTLLTAKVRDLGGQLGPAAQIVVRILPP